MPLSVHSQLVKPQSVPGVAGMDVDGILSRDTQRRDITLRDASHAGNMAKCVHGDLVEPRSARRVLRVGVDGILSGDAQCRDIALHSLCCARHVTQVVHYDLIQSRPVCRVAGVDVGIRLDGRENIRVRLVSCIVHQVVCTGWNGNAHAFLTVHRHFCAVQQHLLDDVLLKLFVVVQV